MEDPAQPPSEQGVIRGDPEAGRRVPDSHARTWPRPREEHWPAASMLDNTTRQDHPPFPVALFHLRTGRFQECWRGCALSTTPYER